MYCRDCLIKVTERLLPNDIMILEYLNDIGASILQCAVSRETIMRDVQLTVHRCYSTLERLNCLGMIERQPKSKTSKYYITDVGRMALRIIEDKMNGVSDR